MMLLAGALTTVLAADRRESVPPCPNGNVARFQMVAGTLTNWEEKGMPTVFRLDTFTGQAWSLQSMPMNIPGVTNAHMNVWQDVEEMNGGLYEAAYNSIAKKQPAKGAK